MRHLLEKAEIIREKGTNRSQFFRGEVDKYRWQDIGSSFLMSEIQAAYLYAQLIEADKINQQRLTLWHNYYQAFCHLPKQLSASFLALANIVAITGICST